LSAPDPERLGGLAWARRTGGLSRRVSAGFGLLVRCGMPLAVRMAPFDE
jgi:hypothetical protein